MLPSGVVRDIKTSNPFEYLPEATNFSYTVNGTTTGWTGCILVVPLRKAMITKQMATSCAERVH